MSVAPHPYTLRQLQYAVAVADTLSFRRAAERCRVSQPSLSAQVALLERSLGVRLFERGPRGVMLSRAGSSLVDRARRLLRDADDMLRSAAVAGDPLASTMRFGVIPTVAPYALPVLAPALRASFDKLSVHWIEDKTEALVEALHRGSLDAVLLALEAPLGAVVYREVMVDAFVLAARPDDALVRGKGAIDRSALREANLLLLDDGHCLREQALAYCSRARMREREFRATSLGTLLQLVANGEGVTLLPSMAHADALRAGLATRALSAPVPSRTIVLAWRESAPIEASLERIAEVLRAGAARHFGRDREHTKTKPLPRGRAREG